MVNRKTRFKGHESFFFREGWLSKALISLDHKDEDIFNVSVGICKLGVGANMVKSIRYWLITSGLIAMNYKIRKNQLTALGEQIAWNDPYLEDDFTLWLIHLQIARNYENATCWNVFFNEVTSDEFTEDEIFEFLKNYFEIRNVKFNEKSLKSDVQILLSMYSKAKDSGDPEENYICPLSRLQIIEQKEKGKYSKKLTNLSILNEKIVLYAILLSIESKEFRKNEAKYINLKELENEENSPIRLLGLNRITFNEYLDRLVSKGYFSLEKTAGLDMLYLNSQSDIADDPINVVKEYYQQRRV